MNWSGNAGAAPKARMHLSGERTRMRPRHLGRAAKSPSPDSVSATYSRTASDSQTVIGPSISAGHLPVGEYSRIRARVSGRSSGITTSSNGIWKWASRIQARSDHEE